MVHRLIPLSVTELYAHALAIERNAAFCYRGLAQLVRGQGAHRIALAFERLEEEEREQTRALQDGANGHALPELLPWECAWCNVFSPEEECLLAPRMPRSPQEALGMALLAERRTESFYDYVTSNTPDQAMRALAAGLAVDEHRHVEEIERLLVREPETRTAPFHDTGLSLDSPYMVRRRGA